MHARTKQHSPHSITVEIEAESGKDWEWWALLRTDAHHDNSHASHELEIEHLEEAVKRKAGIFDAGDLFDAMQGRDDPRREPEALRQEHRGSDYFDQIVESAADFYEPYAASWFLLSPGNHETAAEKRYGVSLTNRLASELRRRGASELRTGAYTGFVRFQARRGRARYSTVMAWHHGYGGGGGTTKGVGQLQRLANTYPDASIIWTGHTHDAWTVHQARSRLRANGATDFDRLTAIRTPGYKIEQIDRKGWAVERGGEPKPIGAAWLRFWIDRQTERLRFEVREALA